MYTVKSHIKNHIYPGMTGSMFKVDWFWLFLTNRNIHVYEKCVLTVTCTECVCVHTPAHTHAHVRITGLY